MAKTARRCPMCSSTRTWGLGKSGLQQCDDCAYRWQPCKDMYCRGYRVFATPSPGFVGCDECDAANGGVKTEHVSWWPEVYRAIARALETYEKGRPVVAAEEDPVTQAASQTTSGGSPGKRSSLAGGAGHG